MKEETCLDLATLEKLRNLGGAEFVTKMINLFFEYVPVKISEARTAGLAGDLLGVQRAVHPIKSSAGNVGARHVRCIASQIEQLALEKKEESIPSLLRDLDEAYSQAKTHLEQHRNGMEA